MLKLTLKVTFRNHTWRWRLRLDHHVAATQISLQIDSPTSRQLRSMLATNRLDIDLNDYRIKSDAASN